MNETLKMMRERERLQRQARAVDRKITETEVELQALRAAAGKVSRRVVETGMRDLRNVERR